MSDFEFRLLRFIHRQPEPVRWVDVVNAFAPFTEPTETDSVLRALLASARIRAASPGDPQLSRITLTDSAVVDLIHENEMRDDLVRQEQKREYYSKAEAYRAASYQRAIQKEDHKFQLVLAFLSAFLVFVFGILAEHFGQIVNLVLSLFHS